MRVAIALSGGMDSSTVLSLLLSYGAEVVPFFFDYGSKHNPYERVAANYICEHYKLGLPHIINIAPVMEDFNADLMRGQGDIPEGHYTDESMSATVVPARNIIFLSVLAGKALSYDCQKIAIGIHQGDHAIYPDCRPEFYDAMSNAIELGTDGKVGIVAPFLSTDKTGVLVKGLKLETPYHLTRTCYKEQPVACGKCGSCVERLEAFALNSVTDPIKYEEG